jgi:hypothetical protein
MTTGEHFGVGEQRAVRAQLPADPRRRAPGRRPRRGPRPPLSDRARADQHGERQAIVADYLDQAARWDAIPAAGPCCLAHQIVEARVR